MKNTTIIDLQSRVYDTKIIINVLVNALQEQSDQFVNLVNDEETEALTELTEFTDGVVILLEDISARLENIYNQLDTLKIFPDPVSVANTLDAVNFPNLQNLHHLHPSNGGRVAAMKK